MTTATLLSPDEPKLLRYGTALAIRIALAAPFLFSGLTKLFDFSAATQEMAHFNLPAPSLIALLVLLTQLVFSTLLIAGRQVLISCLALAGFTMAATLVAHRFWSAPEGQQILSATTFFEHVALSAGLVLMAFVSVGRQPLP